MCVTPLPKKLQQQLHLHLKAYRARLACKAAWMFTLFSAWGRVLHYECMFSVTQKAKTESKQCVAAVLTVPNACLELVCEADFIRYLQFVICRLNQKYVFFNNKILSPYIYIYI